MLARPSVISPNSGPAGQLHFYALKVEQSQLAEPNGRRTIKEKWDFTFSRVGDRLFSPNGLGPYLPAAGKLL